MYERQKQKKSSEVRKSSDKEKEDNLTSAQRLENFQKKERRDKENRRENARIIKEKLDQARESDHEFINLGKSILQSCDELKQWRHKAKDFLGLTTAQFDKELQKFRNSSIGGDLNKREEIARDVSEMLGKLTSYFQHATTSSRVGEASTSRLVTREKVGGTTEEIDRITEIQKKLSEAKESSHKRTKLYNMILQGCNELEKRANDAELFAELPKKEFSEKLRNIRNSSMSGDEKKLEKIADDVNDMLNHLVDLLKRRVKKGKQVVRPGEAEAGSSNSARMPKTAFVEGSSNKKQLHLEQPHERGDETARQKEETVIKSQKMAAMLLDSQQQEESPQETSQHSKLSAKESTYISFEEFQENRQKEEERSNSEDGISTDALSVTREPKEDEVDKSAQTTDSERDRNQIDNGTPFVKIDEGRNKTSSQKSAARLFEALDSNKSSESEDNIQSTIEVSDAFIEEGKTYFNIGKQKIELRYYFTHTGERMELVCPWPGKPVSEEEDLKLLLKDGLAYENEEGDIVLVEGVTKIGPATNDYNCLGFAFLKEPPYAWLDGGLKDILDQNNFRAIPDSPTRCATRYKEEVVTSQKKCLPKRKETRKYFLKRRDHEQYRIFFGEYPNLTGIGSVNAVLAGGSGHHGSLSDPSGSA